MATKTKPKKETKSLDVAVPGGHIEMVKHIKLEDLLPNPYQPETRLDVDPETAKKFAYSIQEHGLIQMPVVRPGKDGKYEVGDGWIRRAGYLFNKNSFQLAGYDEMPCVVKELTDQQMADMVMEANTVRKDLNPIELAKLYKKYLEDFKIPQIELARRHNCSQGEIANTIRLLELPEDIQVKIISQEISETHGRQLLRLNYNLDLQSKMLARTIEEGYSVDWLSNQIQSEIYRDSQNLDPNEYPKPVFDTKECEKCPSRQKMGSPYSNDKKSWRCMDKACYEKKTKESEQARVDQLQAEIAAAKKDAGDKKKDKVLDLSKLTWQDYENLENNYKKIDKTECRNCHKRAVGKNHNGKPESVCIDVKCFKSKEKAYQDKENAKAKEKERQLTERVKAACDTLVDRTRGMNIIGGYLLTRSRKDTRERFARMYGMKEAALQSLISSGENNTVAAEMVRIYVALVLTMERYEGDKGMFQKMMATLEGTGAELEKALSEHRAKHCKGCRHDDGNCKQLLKRYGEGLHDKCYSFSRGSVEEETEDSVLEDEGLAESEIATANPVEAEIDTDSAKAEAESEAQVLKKSLPCYTCGKNKTCDRSFFCTAPDGSYICDQKKSTVKPANTSVNASDSKDPLAELVIHTATNGDKEHFLKLGKAEARAKTLRACVMGLASQLGWGKTEEAIIETLRGMPATIDRDTLLAIMEGER